MANQPGEKGKRKPGEFVASLGENAEVIRKALNDKRVQDAFIEAIGDDPQLIEVLAKVTPDIENVAADWSCCRGYHGVQWDLEGIAQQMRVRESGGGE